MLVWVWESCSVMLGLMGKALLPPERETQGLRGAAEDV